MSDLEALRNCASLVDLAKLLDFKPSALSYLIYKVDDVDKYYEFKIPKRSGGERIIHAPVPALKSVQKRLSLILSSCLAEIETRRGLRPNCVLSHGFRSGLSIKTNATRHRNRRSVFNIDLEDFFPSINFGRVRGYFISNSDFSLDPRVATTIAQIACKDGTLPQGSPCSPIISNLIGNILDVHLASLASSSGCTYTRYADDITFSTNKQSFPSRVATPDLSVTGQWSPSAELRSRVRRSGFSINPKKTRMSLRDSRQLVTGLIVNETVNVPTEYYKNTRAMCHRLFETGTYDYAFGSRIPSEDRRLEPLHGRISYIFNIRTMSVEGERKRIEGWPNNVPGIYKLYRNFLDYKYFYGIARPTLVTEGQTDVTYLRAAIRSLADKYPSLAIKASDGIKVVPHLYKYNATTHAVHELNGGAGDMQALIARYKASTLKFAAPKATAPVIIIVDNDTAARPIFSVIKTVCKLKNVDGTKQFYHIYGNLYVVPLPIVAGSPTDIECFLKKEILEAKIDGKTFHKPNTGLDPAKHFGKTRLAEHVAKQPSGAVDFSDFSPLLDAIVAVQDDYGTLGWR